MNPFTDKVVMITGGASGIGRALCEGLGQRGAVVEVTPFAYTISWLCRLHPALIPPWYPKEMKDFQLLKNKSLGEKR